MYTVKVQITNHSRSLQGSCWPMIRLCVETTKQVPRQSSPWWLTTLMGLLLTVISSNAPTPEEGTVKVLDSCLHV
jgi:hypothetical protein